MNAHKVWVFYCVSVAKPVKPNDWSFFLGHKNLPTICPFLY